MKLLIVFGLIVAAGGIICYESTAPARAESAEDSFRSLNSDMRLRNDQLALENDRLAIDIAKLKAER